MDKYTVTGVYVDETQTTIYIQMSEAFHAGICCVSVIKPRMSKQATLEIAVRDAVKSMAIGTVKTLYGVVYEFEADNSMVVKQRCIDALKEYHIERKR